MNRNTNCKCLFAVISAVVVMLAITYFLGYRIGDWTITTWIGIFIVAGVAFICSLCRQQNNNQT